jgi:hypothetical protein
MNGTDRGTQLHGVFGLLLGWMIAAFFGIAVIAFMSLDLGWSQEFVALVSGLVGLAAAVALMVGGFYIPDGMPWLGNALLFASGFTSVWCVPAAFTSGRTWLGVLAFAVAVTVGTIAGMKRFGLGAAAAPDSLREPVASL